MPRPGAATRIVASRIRRLRDERGWSARRLAEECESLGLALTREIIAKIESGYRDVNIDEMDVLATALGVSVHSLIVAPSVTVLHLSDLQFAPDRALGLAGVSPIDAMARAIARDLEELAANQSARPDLIVVTGDLGFSGRNREFDVAKEFLEQLAGQCKLGPGRIVIVPGFHDVNIDACKAYLAECDANDQTPTKPYWANWRHFAKLFTVWPGEGEFAAMQVEHPWSLYENKELRCVVAGFNSTVEGDLDGFRPGSVGADQLGWFQHRLQRYEEDGWLRIGAVNHNPLGAPDQLDSLSDADRLDRTLGSQLNLLLHGHAGHEQGVGSLPSGLLTLGVGSTQEDGGAVNSYQVIRLAADGATRLLRRTAVTAAGAVSVDRAPEAWSILTQAPWRNVEATFPTTAVRTAPARQPDDWSPATAAWAAVDRKVDRFRDLDPLRELLERVADVFQVRHSGAIIHRIEGDPPMLRVTYNEGQGARQQRIGGHIGTLARADIDAFVGRVHGADFGDDSELIVDGPDVPKQLRDYAALRSVRVRTFVEYQTLVDLTQYTERQSERLTNDARYLPRNYISQTFTESTQDSAPTVREDVVGEMLRLVGGDDGQFILLLGDFGRGKTFALRELTRRITEELPQLTPVLIDLRALDKTNTVEVHIASHLTMHGHEEFDLRVLRYLLHIGRLVLIFDGFDELVARATFDRAAEHLLTLLAAAQNRAKIIVASRTQHFVTSAQVHTAMGARVDLYPQRRLLTLTGMSIAQVRRLLTNHFSSSELADQHLSLLEGLPGLLELARNPRMLGFIAELDEARLRAVAGAGGAISPASLYQQILDAWLSYEHERTQGVPGAPVGLALKDMWEAVTELAVRMWQNDESHIDIQTLGSFAATLTHLAGGRLTPDQISHAVGAGSLLVRDEESNYFAFIHGSVVEWLVARAIADELAGARRRSKLMERKVLSGLTIDFLNGLSDPEQARLWASTTLARTTDDTSIEGAPAQINASRILAKLSSAPDLDLRGISLRGEELANRAWPRVKLQDADLVEARLIAVDLGGADLTNANLERAALDGSSLRAANLNQAKFRRARLARTDLTGADLSGADFTDARLMEVDLTGADVTGAIWRRTAVVAARGEPDLLRKLEANGCTLIPGDQGLEVATRPARIGVRFGFDEGRLPRPVAYDAEGALLAIGNEDGTVLVCDAEDGRPLRTLIGHTERTYGVVFHPRSPLLATGSRDGTARLWDATVGAEVAELEGHPGWVWPMMFNGDGSLLATGADDDCVRVWETATGELVAHNQGHTPPVWSAVFDPAGGALATSDDGSHARIFNIADGSLRHNLDTGGSKVFWLRYRRTVMPDTRPLIIGGCEDTMVRVWDSSTGELIHTLPGHDAPIYALDFHPFLDYIISADVTGKVIQWLLHRDGTPPTRVDLPPHSGAVYRVTFSPRGKLFATGDSDGAIRLWDALKCERKYELPRHQASVWPMMFRADGDRLVTSSNDFTVKVWNTIDGAMVSDLRGHERRVNMVSFSQDDSLLATSGNDGFVRLWDPRTGELKDTLGRAPDRLVSAVFGPKPPLLATASNDGRVLVWTSDPDANELRFGSGTGRMVDLTTDNVWATAFDPDGDRIATANDDGSVEIIYFRTGRSVRRLSRDSGRVRTLAFSPDGHILATAGDGNDILLRDPETDQVLGKLEHHTDRVFSVVYQPGGGHLLASASHDGTVALWDTVDHKLVRVLPSRRGRLWTVAFHPDGRRLATAGDREIIDIWDVQTGAQLAELGGHTRRVCSVAFSRSGEIMASSSTDGTVRLWLVGDDRLTYAATLLGLPGGWVSFTPQGRYKAQANMQGEFWHTAGMIRFEPGELAPFVPSLGEMPLGTPLF